MCRRREIHIQGGPRRFSIEPWPIFLVPVVPGRQSRIKDVRSRNRTGDIVPTAGRGSQPDLPPELVCRGRFLEQIEMDSKRNDVCE